MKRWGSAWWNRCCFRPGPTWRGAIGRRLGRFSAAGSSSWGWQFDLLRQYARELFRRMLWGLVIRRVLKTFDDKVNVILSAAKKLAHRYARSFAAFMQRRPQADSTLAL